MQPQSTAFRNHTLKSQTGIISSFKTVTMTLEGDDVTSTFPLPVPQFPPKKEKDFPS